VTSSAERPSPESPTSGREALSADVSDLVTEEDETTGLPGRQQHYWFARSVAPVSRPPSCSKRRRCRSRARRRQWVGPKEVSGSGDLLEAGGYPGRGVERRDRDAFDRYLIPGSGASVPLTVGVTRST
jgi:hypothetical protein